MNWDAILREPLARRHPLLEKLQSEKTDSYRIFHGISEGVPGLTLDRYGSLVLIQSFRDPLSTDDLESIEKWLRGRLGHPFDLAYNHRGKKAGESFDLWHRPLPEALEERELKENGARFWIRARHQGVDPWLFLDLRAARRLIRREVSGQSVLNLFAYTCGVGIAAAVADAKEVWNVDFASSSLEVGERNAGLNGIEKKQFRTIHEDCIPVMRQLAGLPVGGRRSVKRDFQKFEPRTFDWVVLDPPAWAKGGFGAIDVVGDYSSLFKPAVLAARPGGGRVIATNHVASVPFDAWKESLERCAAKAGRPIRSVQRILPDEDFPSFDGEPPLKIVVCEV